MGLAGLVRPVRLAWKALFYNAKMANSYCVNWGDIGIQHFLNAVISYFIRG